MERSRAIKIKSHLKIFEIRSSPFSVVGLDYKLCYTNSKKIVTQAGVSMAITKEEKQNIFGEFGRNAQDTGSSQVQVALLTKDIMELTEHCQKNPKDHSTRRGLLKKVCNRRSLLTYLQKTDVNKYKEVVAKLGLRK